MPRFFFDITAGTTTVDTDGVELPNAHAARDEAVYVLPDIASDELRSGRSQAVSVVIRDDAGRKLFRASLTLDAAWLVETV